MKKVLITGGPVYGKIDDVKIVTNKFKGGLIAKLAEDLKIIGNDDVDITYLVAKGGKVPKNQYINIIYQDGFDDYMEKVLELAPTMDAVILGSAVANLIPNEPIKGKFPSHNYKEGKIINIPFKITPRVINQVKKVAPNVNLFGFKLLSGVEHDYLIDVAYETVLDAKATCVFANDAKDLNKKYAVTKEKSIIELNIESYPQFIWDRINDEYYHTNTFNCAINIKDSFQTFTKYKDEYESKFKTVGASGYKFGTIAVRTDGNSFLTTVRGKKELDGITYVKNVDNDKKEIEAYGNKPTLNAPLLYNLFEKYDCIYAIVHYHEQVEGLPILKYAIPGTVKDSNRVVPGSFNIEHHGCFLLFDKDGKQL